jgi:hypothetical protein
MRAEGADAPPKNRWSPDEFLVRCQPAIEISFQIYPEIGIPPCHDKWDFFRQSVLHCSASRKSALFTYMHHFIAVECKTGQKSSTRGTNSASLFRLDEKRIGLFLRNDLLSDVPT